MTRKSGITVGIALIIVAFSSTLNAQTNTFPGSGDVGIGTASPTVKLQVYESTTLGSTAGNSQIITKFSGHTGNVVQNNIWLTRNANGSNWYTARVHDGISVDSSFQTPGTDSRTWWEREPNSNLQSWGSSSTTYMTLKGGKLGIGATNPSAPIQVYNNSEGAANMAAMFETRRAGSNIYMMLKNLAYTGGSDYLFFADANGATGFHQGGVGNQFLINQSGNVGIGTSTPDNKLDVKGTIRAEEVIVETGWSDFVFEDGYDLPSLDEVESHIEEFGHLPDVPSAETVETEGLSIGESQKIMMQKIEELTLYVIAQDKKTTEQAREIERLKAKLADLKDRN